MSDKCEYTTYAVLAPRDYDLKCRLNKVRAELGEVIVKDDCLWLRGSVEWEDARGSVVLGGEGIIYIIQRMGDSIYKIGFTTRSGEDRLRGLQTASPEDLILIGEYYVFDARHIENCVHGLLDRYHIAREWFELPEAALKAIMRLLAELSAADKRMSAKEPRGTIDTAQHIDLRGLAEGGR